MSRESVRKWMEQCIRDAEAANKLGILCHKVPRGDWLVTLRLDDLPELAQKLNEYENGGKRERIRERYDLLPPRAIKLVAIAMAEGAAKYGDHNWKLLPENCYCKSRT